MVPWPIVFVVDSSFQEIETLMLDGLVNRDYHPTGMTHSRGEALRNASVTTGFRPIWRAWKEYLP